MIYELRIYDCTPTGLKRLLKRFNDHTCALFAKHGIRQTGYFTSVVGGASNQLTYLLAWESMAEREVRWKAFAEDPEWIKVRDESEKDGPIIERITNQFLAPTGFSALQ